MSRYVWPYAFTLRATGLIEAERQEKVGPVREKYFARSNGLLPVALRWSTIKELGFPREPFQVFRRQRLAADLKDSTLVAANLVAANATPQNLSVFAGEPAYIVAVSVTVSGGGPVTLEALDSTGTMINGQQITLSGNASVEFRCPGIVSLRFFGSGAVGPVHVIGESVYANFPDWQRIQTVGLPFENGEPGAAYNTTPQGFEPPTFNGVLAAEVRTAITALLQLTPPPTGIADFPLPAWPAPNPAAYVAALRAPKSLLPMIERCLRHSDDTNPTKMQSAYVENVTLEGIKQASLPGATANPAQTTNAQLPTTGVTMMAVSTDSYSAAGLGYGTVDVPPVIQTPPTVGDFRPAGPSTNNYGQWDYMVTAPFVFPFGLKTVLAALSVGELPVEAPVGMQAAVKDIHAPVKRDGAAPAVIRVSWQPSTVPQGYGILVSRAPNHSEVLNASRPTAVGGYDPYVGLAPTNPDLNTPPALQIPNFSDTEPVLPLDLPNINTRYLIAGLDVFGQWSGWSSASAALSPTAITKPGVRNATFIMDTPSATGHKVPATLQIDFGWDWQDRSPGQIRFTGQFVPVPATGLGPVPFLTGLQMSNGGATGSPATLTFTYASANEAATITPSTKLPTMDASHILADPIVVLKTANFDPNDSRVQYRVEIKGFTLDFTTVNELDFALYVTAAESIRPGEWSDATISPQPPDTSTRFIGTLVKTMDPFPPPVTFTPPSISWTALPDATGKARGILQWTADPKAAGYYIWEATESALNHLLAPNTPDPAPDTPLVTRGAALKTLVQANQAKSLAGFGRLNKDPVTGNRAEIVVPAAASTLYVYRISATSAANVESSRSDQIAVFGVPRRNVPGIPRLLLRAAKSPQVGMQVIAIPVASGAPPAGYRVFRVRNVVLSYDGSTMGPAKMSENDPGWQSYSSTTLAGNPLKGSSIVDTAAIASWYPYYYRIKAIGQQDLSNGLFAGESGFSDAQSALVLPSGPPMLASFTFTTRFGGALVTLVTDLPAAAASPVGPALVEVIQLVNDSSKPKPQVKVILSSAPEQIAVGTLALPVFPPPHPIPQPPLPHPVATPTPIPHPIPEPLLQPIPEPIPPIHPPPPPPFPIFVPAMRRSTPDTTGKWALYILLSYQPAEANTFMIRLTDPLSRQTVHSF